MKNSVKNSVQLTGNIGKDVHVVSFENGNKKASCILATNEYFVNKNGEKVKETAWHHLVAWGEIAGKLAAAVKKGSEITIQGKLCNRIYTDKSGKTRYITEIVVNDFMKIAKVSNPVVEAVPF